MTTTSIEQNETLNIPVPKRLYATVIQALAAALEAENAPPAKPIGEGQETKLEQNDTAPIDWSQVSNMKRLREGLNSKVAIKLLDMTAARPDVKIPFKEIYTAAGYTETRRAGSSLGSLTKVIKRNFGLPYEKSVWPVEHYWAVNDDAQYYYLMPRDVADAWQKSGA